MPAIIAIAAGICPLRRLAVITSPVFSHRSRARPCPGTGTIDNNAARDTVRNGRAKASILCGRAGSTFWALPSFTPSASATEARRSL